MERFRYFVISSIILTSLAFGQGESQDSAVQTRDSSKAEKKDAIKPEKSYNPAIALTASLLFPGGGQIYTRHYIKAGVYLFSEIGVGLFGYQRYVTAQALKKNADGIAEIAAGYKKDSVTITRSFLDTAKYDTNYVGFYWKLKADSARFEEKETRYVVYQSLAWMAGIYYYNLLDALQSAGFLRDDSKKNPAVAAWLSAIPALGLGQVYNGELSKAGMIFMVQFNLGYLAYNYHRLMVECENYEASMDPNNKGPYGLFAGAQRDKWESRRNNAFRNRNMYLWYSLMFYFYGIFDAVVDAHLHDSPQKMRLEPDLVPQEKRVGLKATIPF